jgi:flagellar M-ring protein FliF
VVRSTQTAEETSDAKESQPAEPVTVTNSLPTERTAAAPGPGSSERANRTEETVNYEISRTVRNQTKRGSAIRRLSIAVQVDGVYRDQPDGGHVFEPRGEEELAQLAALVRSAAGVDESRGDVVEVVSRPFASIEVPEGAEPSWQDRIAEGSDRYVELGVLCALALTVLFFGVRPLLRRLLPEAAAASAMTQAANDVPLLAQAPAPLAIEDHGAHQPADGRGAGSIGQPAGATVRAVPGDGAGQTLEATARQASGRAGSPLAGSIGAVVDASPEQAVRVIRAWLHGS